MNEDIATDLAKIGRDAARQIAGEGTVERVEVVSGEDFDGDPVYHFWFLFDQDRSRERPGLVRIRLIQTLRDELIARGDERLPVIHMLDRADRDKRAGA